MKGPALLVFAVAAAALPVSTQSRSLAITDVTVIDGRGTAPQPAMTVLIRDGLIDTIGTSGSVIIPRGSGRIAGVGKFLMPGLWDMHVHLTDATRSTIPALVAYGVTGVRDMGSMLKDLDEWRVRINAGVITGPRIVRAGPIVNGKEFGPVHLGVADAAEARAAVRALAKAGADFIKIHMTLSREQFFAITNEARRLNLKVAGHVPPAVTIEEASDAGLASIEHTESLFQSANDFTMPREQLFARMTLAFEHLAKNGTYYTPCLITYKASADWRGFTTHPQSKYVARTANARMLEAAKTIKSRPEILEGRQRVFRDFLALAGKMRQAGLKVIVGTDLSDGRIFPGFSVHEELALLVEAGFSPVEAIQAATRRPAELLTLTDSGVVEAGKRADLVLLSADPTRDIRNTLAIDAVVLRGTLLNRARLDALLAESERLAAVN